MKTSNLIYSLNISERASILEEKNNNGIKLEYLPLWRSRKSLVTDELFAKQLEHRGMTKSGFESGIKVLSENDKGKLSSYLQKQSWYLLFLSLFNQDRLIEDKFPAIDFSYALRYHGQWFSNRIEEINMEYKSKITVLEDSYSIIIENCLSDLLRSSMKTFISDMHKSKNDSIFVGKNGSERFKSFLKKRFGNSENTQSFFLEYPTLARLLVERMSFHEANYRQFIEGILLSKESLKEQFGLCDSINVQVLKMDAGDSHNKGKSVIIFEANKLKLVFKYKNLEIAKRFDQFLTDMEKYDISHKFYKGNRIIKECFCIEEFVPHQTCLTEEEIEKYYYQFGQYIAIIYFLRGNDFHFENVIAHGKYPVLIDVETIIQNELPIIEGTDAYAKIQIDKVKSIMGTSMLPVDYGMKRIEPKASTDEKMQLSAFSGKRQLLPFKIQQIINLNTDEMMYEYQDYWMDGSDNIPTLNGKELDSKKYSKFVLEGFDSEFNLFIENKDEIKQNLIDRFSEVTVRNVLKPTQKYADMLDYGYHPNTMSNYIEREKLFENLWGYPYKNIDAVPYEINDLLLNDIPIFFNRTDSKDLLDSNGELIFNYYEKDALTLVLERLQESNENTLREQNNYLKVSLGEYKGESHDIEIPGISKNDYLKNAELVANKILESVVIGESPESISWKQIISTDGIKWQHENINIDLYDGMSGVYVFFLELSKYCNNPTYVKVLKIMEQSLFKESAKGNTFESNYSGRFSVLYPLAKRLAVKRDQHLLEHGKFLLSELKKNQVEIKCNNNDWLGGKASLVRTLILLYQTTSDSDYLTESLKIVNAINLEEIELGGFSHGYSGLVYMYLIVGNVSGIDFSQEIEFCLEKEQTTFSTVENNWKDIRLNESLENCWCHGATGIGFTRLKLIEFGDDREKNRKDLEIVLSNLYSEVKTDDCLCHGNFGTIDFFVECLKSQSLDIESKRMISKSMNYMLENINEKFHVSGLENEPQIGLMTGLAGVGHEYLRLHNNDVKSILLLE